MIQTANIEQINEAIRACKRREHAVRERDRANGLCLSLERDRAAVEPFLISQYGGPERELIRKESRTTLYEALNSLPATQAVRIYRHFFSDLSYSQIARSEGVDESAVRHSIDRGLKQLRKKLYGTGVSARDFATYSMIHYINIRKKKPLDRQAAPASLIRLKEGGEQNDE